MAKQTFEEELCILKLLHKRIQCLIRSNLNSTKSIYETQPHIETINKTLSIISPRILSGHCVKYKHNYYIPIDESGSPVCLKNKSHCLVIESFDKQLYGNISDQMFLLELVPDYEEFSKEFDTLPDKKKEKKKQYIPPMSRPWKHASYLRHLETMAHRQSSAHV